VSVGPERPRKAGWNLQAIDKAMAALPAGSSVLAALAGSPTGDRLAHELRALAARHPQVRLARHTVGIDRDRALGAPQQQPMTAQCSRALAPGRSR
jgi:hypothetical protein